MRTVGLLAGMAWLVCGCAGTSARASELETNASDQADVEIAMETQVACQQVKAADKQSGGEGLPSSTGLEAIVMLRGWFTIVWNAEAHYFVTDDEGRTWELSMDEAVLIPLGGPLALDRKRVEIEGAILSETRGEFRVESIKQLPDE